MTVKYIHWVNLNEENKTFKFERHVSATPVPSSVYRRNYNDVQYIAENLNNNSMILYHTIVIQIFRYILYIIVIPSVN